MPLGNNPGLSMRVPAAFQILTAVMSSGRQDNWSHHEQSSEDVTSRPALDLDACLNVSDFAELGNQTLYSDVNVNADNEAQQYMTVGGDAWVENVIEMTSARDLTSSEDFGKMSSSAVVPGSSDLDVMSLASSVSSSSSFTPSSLSSFMSYGGGTGFGHIVNSLEASGNANFSCLQTLAGAVENGGNSNNNSGSSSNNNTITITVDFSQLSENFNFAASYFDDDRTSTNNTATTTVDLSALQQFMTADSGDVTMMTSQQRTPEIFHNTRSAFSTAAGANVPNSLWNMDLENSTKDGVVPTTSDDPAGVKVNLRSRLYSRNSGTSASLDSSTGDQTLLGASNRSLSSSSSSLTQSLEDELAESDDPLRKREKNRLAAQKCRNKKRDKTESLEKVWHCTAHIIIGYLPLPP